MLTREDVEAIAHLARLELSDSEVEAMQSELSTILDHIEALQAVDTDGVEPMTHAVPMDLRLRPDDVGRSLPVETALTGAPAAQDDCFQVPHIIKTGS